MLKYESSSHGTFFLAEGAGGLSYYRTCPHCGAHLDPGERCDCRAPADVQTFGHLTKKTARSADTTTDGKETPHDT